jgi:hypothetical protein
MTKTHLAAVILAFPLLAPAARGEPDRIAPKALPVDALKVAYLACDRETSRGRMDPGIASRCMAISSELMQRAFEGDFDRLIAWWRTEKARATPTTAH